MYCTANGDGLLSHVLMSSRTVIHTWTGVIKADCIAARLARSSELSSAPPPWLEPKKMNNAFAEISHKSIRLAPSFGQSVATDFCVLTLFVTILFIPCFGCTAQSLLLTTEFLAGTLLMLRVSFDET